MRMNVAWMYVKFMYLCMQICARIYMHVWKPDMHLCMHACMYVCIIAHGIHVCSIQTYTCIYIYIYIDIYVNFPTCAWLKECSRVAYADQDTCQTNHSMLCNCRQVSQATNMFFFSEQTLAPAHLFRKFRRY